MMHEARFPSGIIGPSLLIGLLLNGCSDSGPLDPDGPGDEGLEGNVTLEEFADYSEVGFVMMDGEYHFFAIPGQAATTISAVDPEAMVAYGWFRATGDPDTADESGFVLDLESHEFEVIQVPNVDRTIVRGGDGQGRLVGLANIRATSESFGFIYDLETGNATEIRRPGYDQGALTSMNAAGVAIGYSAFGAEGFVLRDGEFEPLETPEAGRLFPMQINTDGVIVGFWGEPGNWWERSRGFIARPEGSGYTVDPYLVTGGHVTALSGINDEGHLAGLYHPDGVEAPGRVFTARSSTAVVETHPMPDPNVDPWVSGLNSAGQVYGSLAIVHAPSEPEECGGHGHLHGTECHCDSGYQQDPDDPGMCIAQ